MFIRSLLIFGLLVFSVSCSKDKTVYEPSIKTNPYEIYKEALKAFKEGRYFVANKKFAEAEINFDNPDFSAKSAIMSSYALYGINFYPEAEENLKRYLKTYPGDKFTIYAHYLLAIIYYEQIADEKNDMKPLLEANNKIIFFLKKYPESEYAIDLTLKKNLIANQFAAKEIFIAKHYISVQKWVPAINRLKLIIEKYDKTIFIEEALHRLVEIHYHLGLEDEAKKYAKILGYNYNSSKWYEQSYKVFNKNYKSISKTKPNKDKNLLEKIINKIK
jgi:outer membrane protein assembly factor BamD